MTPRGAFLDVRSDPAVSVIVPTYERRELVLEAVASVLTQTFADFELLVVDDGSTDGTGEALAGLDPRLVYVWQENRGVASARNAGIRLARGEIVAFLDSDNRWLPDHLAVVCEMLGRHPEAVLASTCPRFVVQGRAEPASARVVDLLPQLILSGNLGFVSCTAVRRDALVAAGGFDEVLAVAEDSDLWRRLALRGPCALLRRRTIVCQWTRGSLKERGRRAGAYLAANERMSAKALAEIEARPDRHDLLGRARAGRALALGTLALSRHDCEAARARFREACAHWPELSHAPALVGRLSNTAYGPRDLTRLFELAAETWPEPRSDAALFMRAYAAVLALRARAPWRAARLIAHTGFLARPGFALRTWPQTRAMVRRRLHELRHHGDEPATTTHLPRPPGLSQAEPLPAVSVVVPTYERRELVLEAVASVLAQTHDDFELIVVDDGSTDGTGEALRGRDSRLRYVWQENRGVASARNAGIRLARGDLVAFLDSDNRWRPDHLAAVCDLLAGHPEAVLACTSPRVLAREVDGRTAPHAADLLPDLLLGNSAGPVSSTAVHRSALTAVGGFDESFAYGEDGDLWLRLALRGPFALVWHPRMEKGTTPGSLEEQARRAGVYPAVFERSLRSILAELEASGRPDKAELVRRGEGSLRLWHAISALAGGDAMRARAALGEACNLLPELSDGPERLFGRVRLVALEHDVQRRYLEALADLWPNRDDPAAAILRERAAELAAGAAGQG